MLAALPQETDLLDACYDALRHIDHLWDALTAVDGIGAAGTSKLLAGKRPRLCRSAAASAFR
jgi:hypothetical protein